MTVAAPKTRSNAPRTLVLTLTYPTRASYYDDWCDAFRTTDELDSTIVNIWGLAPDRLAQIIDDYDAVVMLHSCNSDTLEFVEPLLPALAQRKRARFLSFIGNEYNSPYISLPGKIRQLAETRCDVAATQLPLEAGRYLYEGAARRVAAIAHALNPSAFPPGPDHAQRPIDVGVKGYRYPAFLGDDDRNRIVSWFQGNAGRLGLGVDISEDKRLDRSDWARFLGSCRGTISTETGSWYLSRDDELIQRVYAYLKSKRSGLVISNESLLRRFARRLPSPIKSFLWDVLKRGPVKFEVLDDYGTPFEELDERFFRDTPRPPVYSKAISSRHFDAIGSKTCQIMLRGRFNDILVANEHYIAVAPDFSDADEAVRRFQDRDERQRIVDAAYQHVLDKHTYAHRIAEVRRELEAVG